MALSDDKPLYVQLRKGRWFWEPPARLRKTHGVKTKALGADQSAAWAMARKLTEEMNNTPPGAAVPGTVAWVLDKFFLTEIYLGLAASTRRDYRSLAKRLKRVPVGDRTLGEINARSIRPRHADLIYADVLAENGQFTAHYCVRFARRVWQWAGRAEHVEHTLNPWKEMRIRGLPQRDQVWAPEQVQAVEAKAVELGFSSIRLAMAVSYNLAHRRGDVLTLTWAMIDAEMRVTNKTKIKLPIVVTSYPELATLLAAERARQTKAGSKHGFVVECELTGRPWHQDTFSHYFREIAGDAGLPPDLQFRDLRATALTEMADAGTDPLDRSTHGGHLSASEDRHYSRRTKAQFERAAQKRNEHRNKAGTVDGTADGTSEPIIFGRKKL